MSYADVSDIPIYGLPATALPFTVTAPMRQGALDSASAFMDSKFRGRYRLPLSAWGTEVRRACAVLASEELLTVRGWDPSNAGDAAIVTRADQVRYWLDQVQRQAAHPDVTESPASTDAPVIRPTVISSSTVGVGGAATAANRGW